MFGGGQGLTDNITYLIFDTSYSTSISLEDSKNTYNQKAASLGLVKWEESPKGFPQYDENTSEIIARRYHQFDTETNQVYRYRELRKQIFSIIIYNTKKCNNKYRGFNNRKKCIRRSFNRVDRRKCYP